MGQGRGSASRGGRSLWMFDGFRRFSGLRLGLRLFVVRLRALLLRVANLDRTLQQRSVFNADARGDHISGERAFAANVQTIGAMNIAGDRAHDYYFLGSDIGDDDGVAPNGDAAVSEIDSAFDSSVDIERLGAADVAFDDHGASDRGLLHRGGYVLGWCVSVRGKLCVVGWVLRWLQHRFRPSFGSVRLV